jgi:hypothetical protein
VSGLESLLHACIAMALGNMEHFALGKLRLDLKSWGRHEDTKY